MPHISDSAPIDPFFEVMTRHLEAVTIEMFSAYELPLTVSSAHFVVSPGEISGAATIGYVGDKVRGAVTVLASSRTVQAWLGASDEMTGEPDWDFGDVLREYSNMLLGRLKARLLHEGLPILLATPTSTCGHSLRLSVPPGQSAALTFDGPAWQVGVRLNATFENGFELRETPNERAAEAGAAILF